MMKDDVFMFIVEFNMQAKLPKAISSSFLELVPKFDNPQGLDYYSIIFLVSKLYKLRANILG